MNEMQTPGTGVAILSTTDITAAFTSAEKVDAIIARIAAEVRSHAPDTSTARGRKAIAALAYRVAQTKVAMDDAGKALTEEARQKIDAVNAGRRTIREKLDALRDEARAPLDKWEAAEEARVDALKARLARFSPAPETIPTTSEGLQKWYVACSAVAIDDSWQEFVADAAKAKDACLLMLNARLAEVERQEAMAAELERLKAEAYERERQEQERLAAEKAAAEEKRLADEAAAALERQRQAAIDAEKEAADRAARAAEEARAQAEAAAREREEALQRELDEARRRQEQERLDREREAAEAEARHAKQLADAKAEQERAAQAERDRIEAERQREAAARAKREADEAHRAQIAKDIADALRTMAGAATPEAIAAALMDGKIPHVQVMM